MSGLPLLGLREFGYPALPELYTFFATLACIYRLDPLGRFRFLELVNFFLSRDQKTQERFFLKTTSLSNPEQSQVVNSRALEEGSRNLSLDCQMSTRPFRHIVVPGYSVLFQESKQAFPITIKPLLILLGDFTLIIFGIDDMSVESPY